MSGRGHGHGDVPEAACVHLRASPGWFSGDSVRLFTGNQEPFC